MSATALRFLSRVPLPGFGNVGIVASYAKNCGRAFGPRLIVPWAFPGFVGFYWFIWPAMGDDFKIRVGWMKDPTPPEPEPIVTLDAKAIKAIAQAATGESSSSHHEEEGVDEAKLGAEIMKALAGDHAGMEKEWDTFYEKSTNPGEDDDDDDEDDDDEGMYMCVSRENYELWLTLFFNKNCRRGGRRRGGGRRGGER